MIKRITILSSCVTVLAACADHPATAVSGSATSPRPVGATCIVSNADPSTSLPAATQKLPPSNIFKLGYFYPTDLRLQHLEGRALVRLSVADSGAVASVEFLRFEAASPVQSAMCGLLRKLKYDLSKPGFESADSRTLVIGVRYCIGDCSRVPAYPGTEKTEISVTVRSDRS